MITVIGKHVVRLGTLKTFHYGNLSRVPADVIYCEAPWGDDLSGIQRIHPRKVARGVVDQIDTATFMTKLFAIVKQNLKVNGVAFIEHGSRWQEQNINIIANKGLCLHKIYHPTYRSGPEQITSDLFVVSHHGMDVELVPEEQIDATHGYATMQAMIGMGKPNVGQTLLDPHCGTGYSARLAIENGMKFVGNEMNRMRLEQTMSLLRKDAFPAQ